MKNLRVRYHPYHEFTGFWHWAYFDYTCCSHPGDSFWHGRRIFGWEFEWQ